MAGFGGGEDEDIISGINVTPLVDIVLVVLIIFMVTTSYIVKAQIEVDLPRAASGQDEVKSTLVFKINADGDYFIDGERKGSLEDVAKVIRQRVAEAGPRKDDLRAVVAADKGVEYGRVVDLIDTIKLNGVEKFALNIERKARPKKANP